MFQALFTMFFNLLATLVQVVCLPLNVIISELLPDFATLLDYITNGVSILFSNFGWFLGIIPPLSRNLIIFLIDVVIAKYTIEIATKSIIKIWNLIHKLKIW